MPHVFHSFVTRYTGTSSPQGNYLALIGISFVLAVITMILATGFIEWLYWSHWSTLSVAFWMLLGICVMWLNEHMGVQKTAEESFDDEE